MAKILLFNFSEGERLDKISGILSSLGIEAISVSQKEQSLTIGYLVNTETIAPELPSDGEPFSDEMIVLEGFSSLQMDMFLNSLKNQSINVPLKAVVTQINRDWSGIELHRQIKAEHNMMKKAAPKTRVHRKKR